MRVFAKKNKKITQNNRIKLSEKQIPTIKSK